MAHAANQVRTQEGSCGLETLAQCSHQETSVGRLCHGVERARITFEIAPDRAQWGIEIAGKVKAWAKALTGPTSLPGKYPQLMNPPGSETGPGQLVTWGKSIACSVDAFGFKFQWTTNSSKHIPFDWTGP
jgi:hypothetical protein